MFSDTSVTVVAQVQREDGFFDFRLGPVRVASPTP